MKVIGQKKTQHVNPVKKIVGEAALTPKKKKKKREKILDKQ